IQDWIKRICYSPRRSSDVVAGIISPRAKNQPIGKVKCAIWRNDAANEGPPCWPMHGMITICNALKESAIKGRVVLPCSLADEFRPFKLLSSAIWSKGDIALLSHDCLMMNDSLELRSFRRPGY